MKTFSGRAIAIFMLFVMIVNQFEPAAALPSQGQPPAEVPGVGGVVAPAAQRGMNQKSARALDASRNQPAAPEPAKIEIELSASPKFVTGSPSTSSGQAPATGETVTVSWALDGDLPAPEEHGNLAGAALTLKISFPTGYTPTGAAASGYDAATRTLSVAVAPRGHLPISAASPIRGEFSLNVQNPLDEAVFPAVLLDAAQNTLAEASLSLPKHEQFKAKKDGSSFSAQKGRVKVSIPGGALPEDATVNIGAPAGEAVPAQSLSGRPFEIDAQGLATKQDLHQFSGEVSIDVDYSDLDLTGKNEGDLYLYWYDPAGNDWYALPTSVDPKTKTLHATTTHFSVFDTGINDWKASELPTVDNFQVSNFTGAATYSLPIKVPAGPGGLQPSLSLSYNSQTIDQSTAQTQASWVGMGWSLGMNSIELDDRGTNEANTDTNWTSDDTWSVSVNGISSTIVRNGTTYRAADENFMKFEYDDGADTWTVWDKSGNTYYFENQVKTKYEKAGTSSLKCGPIYATYKWYLTRMTNIFDKELKYTYANETKNVDYNGYVGGKCKGVGSVSMVTATYPDTITYPKTSGNAAHYRVRFSREARYDYRNSWAADVAYHSFQRTRMDAIFIEQDENGDDSWNTIRKYDFVYATNNPGDWSAAADGTTNAALWPGVQWSQGGYTSTLLKVRQYGVGGTGTQFPTATFSYGDSMHLTRVDNGYGGRIEFEYAPWKYTTKARASQTYTKNFWGSSTMCTTGGFSTYGSGSVVDCIHNGNGSNFLVIRNQAINTWFLNMWLNQNNIVRPGGFYKFTFQNLSTIGANTDLKYGLKFNDDAADTIYDTTFGGMIALPTSASRVDVLLNATGTTSGSEYATFSLLTVQLLTSIYRVTARKVSDGQGHTDTFSYAYTHPAVNDSANSLSSCTDAALQADPPSCQQYREKYSEFRGHSQVTETAPDGHTTSTSFYQDDVLKGRSFSVLVKDAGGKNLSQQLTGYNTTTLSMNQLRGNGMNYNDISRNWITTASEENRSYNSDGASSSYSATQTTYTYASNSSYGNLLAKTESAWNGVGWSPYRTTNFSYFPNTNNVYLTGLPARQWVTDAGGAVLSQSLNIYDSNTTWDVAPTAGWLTAVRTLVGGNDYSQVSYGYNDGWGNRTHVSTYNTYGTSTSAPTSAGITQSTTFDTTYHTYPIWQTTPPVTGFPSGMTTTFTYDYTLGLPLSQTDANGIVTSVEYDGFGRMIKLIKPGDTSAAPTLQVAYNDTARPFRIDLQQKIDASNNYLIRHSYDGLGREILTETGSGSFASFTGYNSVNHQYFYANNQRVTSQSMPYGPGETPAYTSTYYDAFGRPLTITSPSSTVQYAYNGLTTTVTDANGHTTTTTNDVWGRAKSVTPPTGPGLSYDYDPLGQLTDATRAGLTTHIDYDRAGRKIDMSDPDMGYWSYHYDALGNMDSQTDARGCTLSMSYDPLNRLTAKSSSGNCGTQVNTSYTYDIKPASDQDSKSIGRRTGMTDASGSTTWSYDERGRVKNERKTIDLQTFTTGFSYNAADLPVTMTYPDNEVVTNSYTPQMLLDTVSGTSNYVTNTDYDSAGRMSLRSFGNNTNSAYVYNAWNTQGGRLKTLKSGSAADPISLQSLEYHYDAVGNIDWIKDWKAGPQTQNFGYDALDRLTSAYTSGGADGLYSEGYSYDANGNLKTKAGVTLYYDDVNHKHAVSSTSGSNSYSYDADGNQTQRMISGQIYNLSYDAEGRLVTVQNANPQTATPTATKTATVTQTATVTPTATPTATATVPIQANPGAANLVSWWSLNEASGDRADSVGSTTLAALNEPGSAAGVQGSALSVDSASDEVLVQAPDNADISLNATNFSISGWINFSDIPGVDQVWLVKGVAGAYDYYFYLRADGKIVFAFSPDGENIYSVASAQSLSPANWYHVAAVYDGAQVVLYINAGTPASLEYNSGIFDGSAALKIGTFDYGTGISQSIDEVAIWKRALTPNEISWLYNNGAGRSFSEVDPAPTPIASPTETVTPTSIITDTPTVTLTATSTPTAIETDTPTTTATETAIASPLGTETASVTPTETSVGGLRSPWNKGQPGSNFFLASYKVKNAAAPLNTFTAVKSWNFSTTAESWTAPNGISGFAWQTGGYVGGTISGGDPKIFSPSGLSVNITSNKTVKIRYKNTTPSTIVYLFFMTGADTGFTAGKSTSFNAVANSGYIEYTLDMSSVPGWTGTLTRLRFDPAGNSGSFSVDYIWIGNEPPTPTPMPTATLVPTATLTKTPTPTPTNIPAGPTPTPSAPYTSTNARFIYDGDGKMVKSVIDGVTTLFVGAHYEVTNPGTGQTVSKYYFAGGARVAMRKYVIPQSMTLEYTLGDQLGSTSITTDANGAKVSELRYKPWGEVRYTWKDPSLNTTPAYKLTDYTYTGQRSYTADFGLMFYNARWLDPSLGRFAQADTIPLQVGSIETLDRFAYVLNNPISHNDPTGHCLGGEGGAEEVEGDAAEDCGDLLAEFDPVVAGPKWQPETAVGEGGAVATTAMTDGAANPGEYPDTYSIAAGETANGVTTPVGSVESDLAYRYVGEGEANVIGETGTIPNVDINNLPKPVRTTTDYYETVQQAEEGLQAGQLNPGGATSSPAYRVTYLRNIVRYNYVGNSQTGTGIEMITQYQIPVLRIDPLLQGY